LKSNKISILFVAGFYYPSQMGGPCNSFYWMAKALGKANIDVTVMAMSTGIVDNSIVFDQWIETEYGRVIYLKTNYSNYSIKYISTCIRKVKSAQLIHLNSMFSLASFIIGLIAIIYSKPIVWSPRGEFSPKALEYKKVLKRIMLGLIKGYSEKILFHTTSDVESNYTKALFGKDSNLLQLPNYMELPLFEAHHKEDYFLCMGRIHPIKALENLVNACHFSKLFKDSNYQLLIVGDSNNEYGLKLKNLIADYKLIDKIVFVPHVSDIKIKNKLFAEAVFSFLPSHSENFGNVVVESLGNGTPVVASLGTPWQILEETKTGFWVSNEPTELAKIIDKIILMPMQDLKHYYTNARSLACAEFDIDTNIGKWVNGYQQLINSYGKR
jgi:glycosyltransferase involved in cell wall biosynthesis